MEDEQGSRGGMRSRRIRRSRMRRRMTGMRRMGRNRMRRIMGRRRMSGRRMRRRMARKAQVFRVCTMCIENFVMMNPPSAWLSGRGGGREEGGEWRGGG